jgi:hypothetical protein
MESSQISSFQNFLLLLQGETMKHSEKNLSQCHLVHHKSHLDCWEQTYASSEKPAANPRAMAQPRAGLRGRLTGQLPGAPTHKGC